MQSLRRRSGARRGLSLSPAQVTPKHQRGAEDVDDVTPERVLQPVPLNVADADVALTWLWLSGSEPRSPGEAHLWSYERDDRDGNFAGESPRADGEGGKAEKPELSVVTV